jgi:hypothetical protein
MYKNALFALLVAVFLLGSQATSAVEESSFAVGDKWAFGKEIDLMEEASSAISELEGNLTELMSSEEAEMVKNASGLELKSFELDNEAIIGFYYTGEVVDDFDQMIHMQTEQSLYSHTVLGTKFTSMFPKEGEHELRMNVKCEEEMSEEEDCEDPEIKLLDNATGEPLALEELNTEIGGSMHYVTKVTQDTWWTQDTHELARTEITVAVGAAGGITIKNVPNLTFDGVSILDMGEGEDPSFVCGNDDEIPFDWVNDGYENCSDGSDEQQYDSDGNKINWFDCHDDSEVWVDQVNDGVEDCPDGEDEGYGSDEGPFSDCEGEDEHEANCYETIDIKLETAVFEMAADSSIHLVFDFGDDPMNVLDLPLEENKYWDGDMSRLTISGDVGGKVDIKKPELSICPDSDCDQLPEMEELYSGLTEAIQELHDNETFSVTVDRNNDGIPDVITGWNDIFPIYIPETWMNQIFQEILEEISCEDDESAQEGEECDETAEEEFERLNLRIENNRFAFGPYSVHEIEDFSPIPYAFETGEKETARASDGTNYEGYQVFPTDQCSEKNPDRDDDDCDREDDDEGDDEEDDGPDDVIPGGSRSNHDEDREDDCEGDPFCDSEIIWFHDAETGHPAYINMDMPNLGEEGYVMEMMPIDSSVAEAQVDANADTDNPEKTTLIEFDADEVVKDEESALPGFGIMAAIGSLMIAGRRFRK